MPPECSLEDMIAFELEEASTMFEDYQSGVAARMYGKCREGTVAAPVVEMLMKELEEKLGRMTEELKKHGCSPDPYEDFTTAGMQRVRARVAASVKVEHQSLDRPVAHDLHAAALMLLAQLEADCSAAGDGRSEEWPSETTTASTDGTPPTSGRASKEQAASQLPTTASAAGAGRRPEVSSEKAASGQRCFTRGGQGCLWDGRGHARQRGSALSWAGICEQSCVRG